MPGAVPHASATSRSSAPPALERLAVAVLEIAHDGSLVRANHAWTVMSGLTATHSRGTGWAQGLTASDRDRILTRLANAPSAAIECAMTSTRGLRWTRWIWGGHSESATRTVVVLDLSAQRQREDELTALASRDSLTGAVNRAAFISRVDEAIQSGRGQVGVIYVDLDRFKEINDNGGHALGDQVLRLFAERLRQHLRVSDLLGRVGGDEFAVLSVGPAVEVMSVTSRITTALQDPLTVDGRSIVVSASVGIALSERPDDDAETLLNRADSAMYAAKQQSATQSRAGGHDRPDAITLPVETAEQAVISLHHAVVTLEQVLLSDEGQLVDTKLEVASRDVTSAIDTLRQAAFASISDQSR